MMASSSPKKDLPPKNEEEEVRGSNEEDSEDYSSEDVEETETCQTSDGENSLKKRKGGSPKSGEESGENWSDGGSPIRDNYETSDDEKQGSKSWVFMLIFGLVVASGLVWLYYADKSDVNVDAHPLMADVTNVMKKFNLSSSIQKNMAATYREMIGEQRPVMIMIVSGPEEKNPAVSQCFLKSQVKAFNHHFKHAAEGKKIVLRSLLSALKEQCSKDQTPGCVDNKFVESLKNSLKTTGVLWLEGMEALNTEPGLVTSLNGFADHSEAPVKRALVFITASIDSDVAKSSSSVKSHFKKIWTKNANNCQVGDTKCLSLENFNAIWTRIGDFIIDAKTLPASLPDICN